MKCLLGTFWFWNPQIQNHFIGEFVVKVIEWKIKTHIQRESKDSYEIPKHTPGSQSIIKTIELNEKR